MATCQVVLCVLLSTALLYGWTASQEIQLQKPGYVVAENISSDSLVLRVCVEGSNLDSQQYNVQIRTEQSSLAGRAAIDGEDYIGIDQQLTLSGPGADTRCTCVEVLEDQLEEEDEMFELRLSGSPLITRDSVNAFIRDDDGISFRFVHDTPRVVGNVVMFEMEFESNVASATCSVLNHGTVDCSDGTAEFVLPPDFDSTFQPDIVTVGQDGESMTSRDPNRSFRTSSHTRCSVHLINEGVSYNPVTGDVTFEWVWTGPGEEGRNFCRIDGIQQGRCFSPYTVSGLSSGSHTLRINVRAGDCERRSNRNIRFQVPN